MDYIQLDLFDIADENERKSARCQTSSELTLGDIIHVEWTNGIEWEGVYTGLKGFWDDREEFRHWDWIYATKCWSHGEPSDRKQYVHVDLHRDDWNMVGRDECFRLPDPSNAVDDLKSELFKFPLKDRIKVYQRWQENWAYLSFNYHKVTSHAWEIASAEVTTLDELLAAEKGWSIKASIPAAVENHITNDIFPLNPERWLSELTKIRWSEPAWKDGHGRQTYWVYWFPEDCGTYWKWVIRKCLVECRTSKELISILRMWGADHRATDSEKPRKFWIEDGDAK